MSENIQMPEPIQQNSPQSSLPNDDDSWDDVDSCDPESYWGDEDIRITDVLSLEEIDKNRMLKALGVYLAQASMLIDDVTRNNEFWSDRRRRPLQLLLSTTTPEEVRDRLQFAAEYPYATGVEREEGVYTLAEGKLQLVEAYALKIAVLTPNGNKGLMSIRVCFYEDGEFKVEPGMAEPNFGDENANLDPSKWDLYDQFWRDLDKREEPQQPPKRLESVPLFLMPSVMDAVYKSAIAYYVAVADVQKRLIIPEHVKMFQELFKSRSPKLLKELLSYVAQFPGVGIYRVYEVPILTKGGVDWAESYEVYTYGISPKGKFLRTPVVVYWDGNEVGVKTYADEKPVEDPVGYYNCERRYEAARAIAERLLVPAYRPEEPEEEPEEEPQEDAEE